MTSEQQAQRDETVNQVGRLMAASELTRPDMLITDIVIVVTQRGYDEEGGTSLTVTLVPTDTPQPMVVGLLKMATIEHDERAAAVYRHITGLDRREDDDE